MKLRPGGSWLSTSPPLHTKPIPFFPSLLRVIQNAFILRTPRLIGSTTSCFNNVPLARRKTPSPHAYKSARSQPLKEIFPASLLRACSNCYSNAVAVSDSACYGRFYDGLTRRSVVSHLRFFRPSRREYGASK